LPARANAAGRGLSAPPAREIGFAPETSRAAIAQLCRVFQKAPPTGRRKTGMAPTAAYLIALALTLLILLVIWEGLS
jgi:hypothetical protein